MHRTIPVNLFVADLKVHYYNISYVFGQGVVICPKESLVNILPSSQCKDISVISTSQAFSVSLLKNEGINILVRIHAGEDIA